MRTGAGGYWQKGIGEGDKWEDLGDEKGNSPAKQGKAPEKTSNKGRDKKRVKGRCPLRGSGARSPSRRRPPPAGVYLSTAPLTGRRSVKQLNLSAKQGKAPEKTSNKGRDKKGQGTMSLAGVWSEEPQPPEASARRRISVRSAFDGSKIRQTAQPVSKGIALPSHLINQRRQEARMAGVSADAEFGELT